MTTDLEGIVKTLSNLKVGDLAKLKKMLSEEWGVSAEAPAMVAMAPGGAAVPAGEAAAESTEFQVTLASAPADKKIGLIKVVREVTGLGLKEAKDIVEGVPKVIKETSPKEEANSIVKKIEEAGGKATLKGL